MIYIFLSFLLAAYVVYLRSRRHFKLDEMLQWLALASHEIRTPLNAALASVELLMSEPTQNVSDIRLLHESLLSALYVLNNVLDFSKLKEGKLPLHEEVFNVRRLVEDAVLLFQPQAVLKSIDLSCRVDTSVPIWLNADASKLRQCLMNLVSNGLKYTDKGKVVVSLSKVDHSSSLACYRIAVQDTGKGIHAKDRTRLFQEFSQLGAPGHGTGLGLVLVEKMVKLWGGNVDVQSEPGRGSTFSFTFFATCQQNSPSRVRQFDWTSHQMTDITETRHSTLSSSKQCLKTNGHRILCIDDDVVNLKILRTMVERFLHCEVVTALSGKEALDIIKSSEEAYELIFLDLHMPDMNGIEVAKLMRNNSIFAGPIVGTTASDCIEDRTRCLAAGMNEVIMKPFTLRTLRNVVDKWIQSKTQ